MEQSYEKIVPSTSSTDEVFAYLEKNYPMVKPLIDGVKYVFPEFLQLIAYFIIIIIIAIVLIYASIKVYTQISK